jgi:hypothetical protein
MNKKHKRRSVQIKVKEFKLKAFGNASNIPVLMTRALMSQNFRRTAICDLASKQQASQKRKAIHPLDDFSHRFQEW